VAVVDGSDPSQIREVVMKMNQALGGTVVK
jgi:hypothetical protein